MTGDDLPNADHIARYCPPRQIADGLPLTSAFVLRAQDSHLSVNWLEFFDAPNLTDAVDEMRAAFGAAFDLRPNGRFAVLNVRNAKLVARAQLRRSVRIQHLPTDDNPAHSGIAGYSATDTGVAVGLAYLASAGDIYPALD